MIEVACLTKQFAGETVLKNVSVDFEDGKIYGIIGRNGSGKTVLFKCICGFIRPTSGTIDIGGKRMGRDMDMIRNAGIILETPGFLSGYSGLRNLLFLSAINHKITRQDAEDAMRRVRLNPHSKKHVSKYSLGMRQRLGIAQAIMENPDILILDEPMNGLDNRGVLEIRELLLELRDQGKTIILASHNRDDIQALCDVVFTMEQGNLYE